MEEVFMLPGTIGIAYIPKKVFEPICCAVGIAAVPRKVGWELLAFGFFPGRSPKVGGLSGRGGR